MGTLPVVASTILFSALNYESMKPPDTPRTNAACFHRDNGMRRDHPLVVTDDFARELERELDEAIAEATNAVNDIIAVRYQVKQLRKSATYEHAGCTASAMGWSIKYANIHELALRLVQATGRFHTQKAFEDLREFISSENDPA